MEILIAIGAFIGMILGMNLRGAKHVSARPGSYVGGKRVVGAGPYTVAGGVGFFPRLLMIIVFTAAGAFVGLVAVMLSS